MSDQIYKIRLKKGDNVVVRAGKYKGKSGKVTAVHPRLNKVTVEGINIVKKHQKPDKQHPQGGIIEVTQPIWVSKVGIASTGAKKKPEKIAYKLDKTGKHRVYKTNGKRIDS